MKKILPFDISPECISYQYIAFPLGIIKANLSEYDVWFADKLINCKYQKAEPCFDIIDEDLWGNSQNLVIGQSMSINRPTALKTESDDTIELIRHMMQSEHYLTGYYNEYYIPGKSAYKKYNFIHDYLLFGYDDGRKVFKSAGYLSSQKYEVYDIEYSVFLEGIYGTGADKVDFWFHEFNKNAEVQLEIESIVQNMRNYMNSVRKADAAPNENTYGIAVWDKFAKYVLENKSYIDLRYSRSFMEHKSIMLSRLYFLQGKGYLQCEELLTPYKMEIMEQARLAHYLCMKSNLSHNLDINVRIYDIVNKINSKEGELLNNIVKMIGC